MVVKQSSELLFHVAYLGVVKPFELVRGQLFLFRHLLRRQFNLKTKLGIILEHGVLGLLAPLVKRPLKRCYRCRYIEFIHDRLPHLDGLYQMAVEVGVAVEDLKVTAHLLAYRICRAELRVVG